MTRKLVEFEEKPEGLVITIVDDNAREEIEGIWENDSPYKSDVSKWAEVIEFQLENGWEWPHTEELGNLMDEDQPYLSQEVERDDHGKLLSIGEYYYWNEWAIEHPIEVLIQRDTETNRPFRDHIVFLRA